MMYTGPRHSVVTRAAVQTLLPMLINSRLIYTHYCLATLVILMTCNCPVGRDKEVDDVARHYCSSYLLSVCAIDASNEVGMHTAAGCRLLPDAGSRWQVKLQPGHFLFCVCSSGLEHVCLPWPSTSILMPHLWRLAPSLPADSPKAMTVCTRSIRIGQDDSALILSQERPYAISGLSNRTQRPDLLFFRPLYLHSNWYTFH